MENVSDKSFRETRNTHFILKKSFFSDNRAVYEIMWKNIVERVRPQITIWRMRIAYLIIKTTHTHTHTHSECETFIAFPTTVTRKRPNVTLYVHCLSCYSLQCVLWASIHLGIITRIRFDVG